MIIAIPALDALAPLSSQRVRLPKHDKYTIKSEGIFTVVQRIAPLPLNNAAYAVLYRWARAYTRWLPLLMRFVRMTASVSPGRFAIYWLGKIVSSMMDTATLWSDTRLEALVSSLRPSPCDALANHLRQVEQAVGTRAVKQASLIGYACANILSTGLRSRIEALFTSNEGALSATFDVAVRKRLIQARGKLDIVTLADPIVSSAFRQANAIQGLDVASHVVNLCTGVFAIWSQLSLYRLLTGRKRTITYKPIVAFTFAASLLQYFRWLVQPPKSERSKSTHFAFQRLNELWSLSCQAEDASSSADIKLLNIQEYLSRQFELASDKLADLPFIRNVTKPTSKFALEIAASAWPVVLRTIFALQAVTNPASIGSLSQLSITILCARKIAVTISNLVSIVDDIRLDCSKIKAFYEVMDVKSQIEDPEKPLPYKTQSSLLGSGMKVEFKNVSFGYNGGDGPMALKNLDFVIRPGALACIVGGNGAGKVIFMLCSNRQSRLTSSQVYSNQALDASLRTDFWRDSSQR